MDAHPLWQAALGQLQLQLEKRDFDTWLEASQAISFEDGVLVVGVRNAMAKDWLEGRLYGPIQRTVSETAHRSTEVRFIVQRSSTTLRLHEASSTELLTGLTTRSGATPGNGDQATVSHVNPKYTFDNYVVGESNRLARAGCEAVADSPGLAYNPLFIYGGVGLGKTHLLHAIGNHVQERGKHVLYVSAETFTNGIVEAIGRHSTDGFRAQYRTIDVLLFDDVQFLSGKERTTEEFFHTYNDLYQDDKQIVLSSDRPPKAFVSIEERLRSRFEWGLTVDVQAPDLETRMAILMTKAEANGVRLPADVVEHIARAVPSNIRELEGALNRFMALTAMMDEPITVATADKAIGTAMRPAVKLGVSDIITVVARVYGLSSDDIVGRRRTADIALARQVVMYLARELTSMSLPQIGQALGGRDHTTVIHGYRKVAALFDKDDDIRRQVLDIKGELYGTNRGVSWEQQRREMGVRNR